MSRCQAASARVVNTGAHRERSTPKSSTSRSASRTPESERSILRDRTREVASSNLASSTHEHHSMRLLFPSYLAPFVERHVAAPIIRASRSCVQSATDGEFRRASWHMDFIYQLDGITKEAGHIAVKFHNPEGDIEFTPAALHVNGELGVSRTIFGDDFRFLRESVAKAVPKLTVPSPSMVHYRGQGGDRSRRPRFVLVRADERVTMPGVSFTRGGDNAGPAGGHILLGAKPRSSQATAAGPASPRGPHNGQKPRRHIAL